MTTLAAELFLTKLAKESHRNAKSRGRNTIRCVLPRLYCLYFISIICLTNNRYFPWIRRYEDLAETRTKDPALSFLDTLVP